MHATHAKRRPVRFQSPRVDKYLPFIGGIDIVTQTLKRNPGTAKIAINFEPGLEDGFRRIDGYECFDGQDAPSDAVWYTLELTDASDRAVGETITGNAGGEGVIVLIDGNTIAITAFNGMNFVADETTDGAGDVVDVQLQGGGLTNYDDIEIELAAQDYYRALIEAMPGEGDVLGVYIHRDKVYGFRNDVGGSEALAYIATSAGWDELPLYHVLRFDAGTAAFVYDEAITSAGTGVGVVKKVVKLDGEWADNDATGYLIVSVTSGSFLDNELLTGGTAGSATASANAAAIALQPDGKYQFISHNFYATNPTYEVYGCDNENYPFSIDTNDVYCPIYPGTVTTPPKYLCAHKFYLWFGIGETLVRSNPGDPYIYDGTAGAGQIAIGASITGMKTQPGEIMSTATTRSIWGIYGAGSVDDPFRPEIISEDAGAADYSFITLGYPFGLNDQGVVAQQRVTAYGNFESAAISRLVQPLIDQKRTLVVAAATVRKRNQLRFYFSDKTVLVMCFTQSAEGMSARSTLLTLDHQVTCICNGADSGGSERIFFGSTDGFVYEMEKGFSFDGEPIDYYLMLNHWNPFGSVNQEFRVFGCRPMIAAQQTFMLKFSYELSYGTEVHAQPLEQEREIPGGGGTFDEDNWDDMQYDAPGVQNVGFPMTGKANSAACAFYNSDTYAKSFTISGNTMDVSQRGKKRAY